MIVILNGSFGIGKTTVAQHLVRRLPGSSIFNAELIGIPLQRAARLIGRDVPDFQDLRLWRRLTVAGLRIARALRPIVVVPMAFSNVAYLSEIRTSLERFEPLVLHVCLIAPIDVVHARLRKRGDDPTSQTWGYARAAECCSVHMQSAFAEHIPATGPVEQVVEEVHAALRRLAPAGAA